MKTATRQAGARPQRRWWRRIGLILLCGGLALLGGLGLALLAATSRPAWYSPAAPDLVQLRDDKAALVELQERISAALNSGRDVHISLSEDQLNRWLAARNELWPEQPLDFGPLVGPQLRLENGVIRIAATARYADWRAVLTLGLRVAVDARDLHVEYFAPQVGRLPIPRSALTGMGAPLADAGGTIDEAQGAVHLPNEWIWPNGKRRCRLRELQVLPGRLEFTIEPASGLRSS